MTESIGTYYADIRPDARGFITELRAQTLPQMDQFGRDAGERFAAAFARELASRIPDTFTRTRSETDRRSRESGRSAGDAFGRQLNERVAAAIRALPDVSVGADTTAAQAKIAEIRGALTSLHRQQIEMGLSDADVLARLGVLRGDLDTLTGREHDIRIRVDAAAAAAEIAALQAGLRKLDDPADQAGKKLAAADKSGGGLLKTLLLLAPAAVAVGGAAVAAGAGAVAGLGALAIGIAGVRAEMKAGTAEGVQYAAGLGVLKGDLHSLEQVASAGLLKGFDQAVDSAHAKLPQLRADIAATSSQVGDIGAHAVGGIAAGFQTFEPVIQKVLGYADQAAAKFEQWASGPGGSKFAQTLSDDLDHVIPALGNIAHLVEKILSGLNGPGMAELDVISRFAGMLADLPPGVFEALAAGYIAYRTAVAFTGPIDRATAAWLRLTAAEREAAAGGAGGAAARGGLVSRLGRGLGIGLGVDLGAQFLGQMADNSGWKTSSNRFQFDISHEASALGDLAHGDFSGALGNSIVGSILSKLFGVDLGGQRSADRQAVEWTQQQQQFNQGFIRPRSVAGALSVFGPGGTGDAYTTQVPQLTPRAWLAAEKQAAAEVAKLAPQIGLAEAKALAYGTGSAFAKIRAQEPARTQSVADYVSTRADTIARGQETGTNLAQSLFTIGMQNTSNVAQASTAYDQMDSVLQKAIDTRHKWLDQGGTEIFQYHGLSIGAKTWADALDKTNGNQTEARALIEGTVGAMEQQQGLLDFNTKAQERVNSAVAAAEQKYKLTGDQVDIYATLLGVSADQLGRGTVSQREFVREMGEVDHVVSQGNTALQGWVAAIAQFTSGTDTAASRAQLLGAAMVALNGDTLSYANQMVGAATANQQLVTDFANLKHGVLNLKTGTLDYHNAAAAPLLSDLAQMQTAAQNAAAATYQHEVSLVGARQAAKDASDVYYNDTRNALISEATQLGLTHTEAKKLADTYFHWPKDAKTQIEALGGDKTKATFAAILEDLDKISGNHHSDLYVNVHSNVPTDVLAKVVPGGIGVKYQAQGGILEYYAAGGLREHHVAQIAPRGTTRVWNEPETGGEAYIPLAPAKRARSRDIAAEVVARLGGFAAFFESGGFTGVTGPSSSSGSSGSPITSSAAASKDVSSLISTVKSAISSVTSALFGSTKQLKAAEDALLKSVKAAGASDQILAKLSGERATLLADSALLAKTTSQVQKAHTYLDAEQQKYASFKSSVEQAAGAFDITSAGTSTALFNDRTAAPVSFKSILAGETGAADRSRTFTKQLAALRARGLNETDYMALATGDPAAEAAQLKALSGASKAQIAQLNAQQKRLGYWGYKAGTGSADYAYGPEIGAAKALLSGVDPDKNPELAKSVKALGDKLYGAGKWAAKGIGQGLVDEEDHIRKAIKHIDQAMIDQIEKDLGIHSPAEATRWHGQMIPRGLALGILDELPAVRDAAARMAIHAQPVGLNRPGAGSRAGWWSGRIELNGGIVDAAALAREIDTLLWHREQAGAFTGSG
jgi:hypothetical protein